jgi:prepilin-type N-terminal cleavage/methylation domain-containing protein
MTPHLRRYPHRVPATSGRLPAVAFTLMELLVVIAIIGALVAIGLPAARNFNRGSLVASAARQLQDDLSIARQRAISSRSEVFMVFASPAITALTPAAITSLTPAQRTLLTNLFQGQYTAYALYSPRTVGDQPGSPNSRYLTPWRTLPKGVFIPAAKFSPNWGMIITNLSSRPLVQAFMVTNAVQVPFPTVDSPITMKMPFIGFDYQGRLLTGREETIPIAEGVVDPAKAPGGQLTLLPAVAVERPPGNWTNQPNLVRVDWLTGRARVEKLEVK